MSSALSVGYRLCRILATRVLTYAVFLFIAIGNPFSALLLATPGDLYVSESSRVIDSDLIQHFHPNGAKEDNLASDLNFARGLVFDSLGNLFAVDLRSGSIRKFDRAGARIAFISGEGAYNLMGLAFDNAGNLFVSKFISEIGSISKFAPNGSRSVFATDLDFPAGLAFDASGNLFVSEEPIPAGDILKFSPDGSHSVFASNLRDPVGLTFDHSGNLVVAEQCSGNILKFTPSGVKSVFATVVQDKTSPTVPHKHMYYGPFANNANTWPRQPVSTTSVSPTSSCGPALVEAESSDR